MKTKNYSVRFEENHFKFICEREELDSAQKVVSFLLTEYVNRNKGGGSDILKSLTSYNGFSDKIAAPDKPIVKEEINPAKVYQSLIDNFRGGQEEGELLMRKILGDMSITKWQKDSLKLQLNSKAL